MKPSIQSVTMTAIGALLLIVPRLAGADAAPPVLFHSIAQEGQDVKIVLEQPEYDWNAQGERDLVRVEDDVETKLYSFILDDETPTGEGKTCGSYIYEMVETGPFCESHADYCHECDDDESTVCIGESCEDCTEFVDYFTPLYANIDIAGDEFPEYKVDCDEDGTAECCLTCDSYNLYEFWDRCVPEGDYIYKVTYDASSYTEIEDYEELTVTESGESCDDPSTDEPEDTEDTESSASPNDTSGSETGADTTDSDDNGGCSVTGIGRPGDFGTLLRSLLF